MNARARIALLGTPLLPVRPGDSAPGRRRPRPPPPPARPGLHGAPVRRGALLRHEPERALVHRPLAQPARAHLLLGLLRRLQSALGDRPCW